MLRRIFALLAVSSSLLLGDYTPKWNQPIPPFRIISNLYYVGTNYLASYLITTPEGNILINPNYEQSVPLLRQSIEKLGFRFSDTKTHSHQPRPR